MRYGLHQIVVMTLAVVLFGGDLLPTPVFSQTAPTDVIVDANGQISAPIRSLTGLQPLLPDVSDYIVDLTAAQQLGKALFWDTQVGSDGTACASCHFHAGADIRVTNQVNPGLKSGDVLFGRRLSGSKNGPDKEFKAEDFPFHKVQDPTDRDSAVEFDSNDVFSSQGTFGGDYISARRGHSARSEPLTAVDDPATDSIIQKVSARGRSNAAGQRPGLTRSENCNLTYTPLDPRDRTKGSPFHTGGLIYRKVEPRNTPSTVNAVFNLRQFWDGRANNQFNGVDPFGRRTYIPEMIDPIDPNYKLGNPNAETTGIIVALGSTAFNSPMRLDLRQPLIENASLASQAVGPPLSDFEMSCKGKTFKDLGRKLIRETALSTQVVDPLDSVFSKTEGLINPPGVTGLNTTYRQLIKKAFKPKYWMASGRYVIDPITKLPVVKYVTGFTQMEHNFSLFWGLAIQAYEQLLIAGDSPFDRYMNGDKTAMSPQAVRGMSIFNSKGNCFECHSGPVFSSAAVTNDFFLSPAPVEGMLMRDGNRAMYDGGYYNIGVRPTAEDIGTGALDPYGFDLSYTRQYRWQFIPGGDASSVDFFDVNRCTFEGQHLLTGCLMVPSPQRDAVDGSFKTPSLRNVALTPPYFHNGGTSNLKDVLRFYNRGGDRRLTTGGDTSGFDTRTPLEEINQTNLAPGVGEPIGATRKGLGLTEREMDDLLEFLLALTDDRVACHADVFDHPELPLPLGQRPYAATRYQDRTGPQPPVAADLIATLPATGRLGLAAVTGECLPASGDLFGSVNKSDPRGLQATLGRILIGPTPDRPPPTAPDDMKAPAPQPTSSSSATATSATSQSPTQVAGGLASGSSSGQLAGGAETGGGAPPEAPSSLASRSALLSGASGLKLQSRQRSAVVEQSSSKQPLKRPESKSVGKAAIEACIPPMDSELVLLDLTGANPPPQHRGIAASAVADAGPSTPLDQDLNTGKDVRVD